MSAVGWFFGLLGIQFKTPIFLKAWMEAPPPPPPSQQASSWQRLFGLSGLTADERPAESALTELVGVFLPAGRTLALGENATLLGVRVVEAAEAAAWRDKLPPAQLVPWEAAWLHPSPAPAAATDEKRASADATAGSDASEELSAAAADAEEESTRWWWRPPSAEEGGGRASLLNATAMATVSAAAPSPPSADGAPQSGGGKGQDAKAEVGRGKESRRGDDGTSDEEAARARAAAGITRDTEGDSAQTLVEASTLLEAVRKRMLSEAGSTLRRALERQAGAGSRADTTASDGSSSGGG